MSIGSASLVPGMADVQGRMAELRARIEQLSAKPVPGRDFAVDRSEVRTASLAGAAGPTGAAPASPPSASGAWVAKLSERGQAMAPRIQAAAERAGIEPALLAAVVRHESNFDQDVVSHAGAIGAAQLMPGTAAGLGVDPNDLDQNLAGGARYLREQLDRFGSNDLALAAYNAGPNRVAQAGGVPRISETQTYVQRVLATYQELS